MDFEDIDFGSEEGLEPNGDINQSPSNEGSVTPTSTTAQPTGVVIPDATFDDRSSQTGDEHKDVITSFLKYNGIEDPEHIKFEDEDGIVKDRNWNELSFEEKMNILTTSREEPERDLTDDEIKFINDIRTSRLSPEQYINTIRQKAAQDYAANLMQAPQYSIDELSDDEIFMLDLQDKVEDVTDEEIAAALNKAKEDPLFEKRVAGMRKALKEQENQYNQQIAAEQQYQQQEQFNQFKDAVLTNIQSLNKVGDLDLNLEVEDMEDIASFILDIDNTGMSYFGKALNDPRTLVEMAWWTLKGRDAINSISEYFVNEIKNQKQIWYDKGLEDGKKGSNRVVYKQGGEYPNSVDNIWG